MQASLPSAVSRAVGVIGVVRPVQVLVVDADARGGVACGPGVATVRTGDRAGVGLGHTALVRLGVVTRLVVAVEPIGRNADPRLGDHIDQVGVLGRRALGDHSRHHHSRPRGVEHVVVVGVAPEADVGGSGLVLRGGDADRTGPLRVGRARVVAVWRCRRPTSYPGRSRRSGSPSRSVTPWIGSRALPVSVPSSAVARQV